jgi:hypothetical protein
VQKALSLVMIHDSLGNMTVNVPKFMRNFPERVLANTRRLSPHLSADFIDSTQTKRSHSSISILGVGNLQQSTRDFHFFKHVTAKVCFEYMPAYFQLWISFPGKYGVSFKVCRQANKII